MAIAIGDTVKALDGKPGDNRKAGDVGKVKDIFRPWWLPSGTSPRVVCQRADGTSFFAFVFEVEKV